MAIGATLAMGCDDKSMKHSPPRSYYHGSNYNYKSIKRTSSHNKLQMSGSYTAAASQMGSHSAGYGVNMYSGPVPTFSAVPIMMPMQPFSSPAYGYPYAPGAAAPMPMYAPMMGCSGPSMQDPVADAQKILQPFIWNTDSEDNGSHALVVAHSPNYNAPEKIKLLCEKYGTLYYCNQDFTRVCGVTFICYDDYRNAISAIRGLGQDIQQLLSKVSSPPPTKENDATVPTNSGEVFVAFTPILFSMNNSALTSRALRQSRSTSSLISLGQTIAAAGTSTPPRGLVATGPSSDSKGESDGASSAAAPDTAAMNTPVTVPNAIVPEANVLFQNVSTLMGQNIPSSFSVGSIQCVFQGYGQLRKITPLRAVSTESDKPEEFVSYSVEYYLLSEARYALNALSGLAQQIWGAGFEGEGRARSAVAAGGVRAVPTVRYSSLSADQSILAQQFHQCLYHWRWFVHHQQMLIASGNMPPVAPVPAIPQPLSSEHPPRTYDSVPVGGAEPAISPQAYLAMVEGVVDQTRSAGTDSAIARSKDSLSVGTEVPVPGRGVTSPLAIPPANREQGTHRSPSEYPAYGPRAPARLTSASVLGPETVPGAGRPIVPMHTTPRPQHHYGGHVPKKFQSTNGNNIVADLCGLLSVWTVEPLMESYDAGASRGDANSPVNVPGSGSATVRQGGNIVLNNTIDCVAIEDGLDTRVTVMVRCSASVSSLCADSLYA